MRLAPFQTALLPWEFSQVHLGLKDTAAIISRYGHGIAIRRYVGGVHYGEGNLTIREYAKYATVPVTWNAMYGILVKASQI